MTLQAGNYVIRQGEEINRLYIVGKGSLEVLNDGNLLLYLSMYLFTKVVNFVGLQNKYSQGSRSRVPHI